MNLWPGFITRMSDNGICLMFSPGSDVGKVVIVDIQPCPKQPCELHKGQAYAVNVTFNSGKYIINRCLFIQSKCAIFVNPSCACFV